MERLIEIVRKHPVLYNQSHQDYMKTRLKEEIWKGIAKELNYEDGDQAKENWRKLRDCHRDALRRQKRKRRGEISCFIKPWVFQKQMEFLLPFMGKRQASSGNLLEEDDKEEDHNSSEVLEETSTGSESQEDHEPSSFSANDTSQGTTGQKRKKVDDSTISFKKSSMNKQEEMTKDREMRREFNKEEVEDSDGLYHFFLSMYKTTKKLPPLTQLQIKRDIFNAVSRGEELFYSYSNQPVNPGSSNSLDTDCVDNLVPYDGYCSVKESK